MKQFRCGDVVPGCTQSFKGATEQDILTQVADHARQDHGLQEVPAGLIDTVRSQIVEVPAT